MYYIHPNGTISPIRGYYVESTAFQYKITIILPIETLQFYHKDYECLLIYVKSPSYIKQYHPEYLI